MSLTLPVCRERLPAHSPKGHQLVLTSLKASRFPTTTNPMVFNFPLVYDNRRGSKELLHGVLRTFEKLQMQLRKEPWQPYISG